MFNFSGSVTSAMNWPFENANNRLKNSNSWWWRVRRRCVSFSRYSEGKDMAASLKWFAILGVLSWPEAPGQGWGRRWEGCESSAISGLCDLSANTRPRWCLRTGCRLSRTFKILRWRQSPAKVLLCKTNLGMQARRPLLPGSQDVSVSVKERPESGHPSACAWHPSTSFIEFWI